MSIQAKIKIGYNRAKKILNITNIPYSENTIKSINFSGANFSPNFIELSQSKEYTKIYETARKFHDYDLLLEDDSIFQFTYEEDSDGNIYKIRYSYYEPPNYFEPYEEFLKKEGFNFAEVGDLFYEDYVQYKNEADLKQSVTPIRYDYDTTLYKGLKHCASHLHIGHNNEVRIPLSLIISPDSFVTFVIRQIYYAKWKSFLDDTNYLVKYLELKSHCTQLNGSYFTNEEKLDFYIL